MEISPIEIKPSKIHGLGIFAMRDIKKGEIVLRWKPKVLSESEVEKLPREERKFVFNVGGNKYYLMQKPERYMNHSCENNTTVQNDCDVAIRDIKAGEEITANYNNDGIEEFACHCGSGHCRGTVK